jgi:hypothetical protein
MLGVSCFCILASLGIPLIELEVTNPAFRGGSVIHMFPWKHIHFLY